VGIVTVRDAFKPFSVAVALFAISVACRPAMRAAFRRRSPFAFYAIAAIFLLVCSLGPTPTFLGGRMFYRPPYAWLMNLPLFAHGVRVPARFAMPAVLALSVAAALAFHRFPVSPRVRRALAIVLAAGVLADGWIHGLALPEVPGTWHTADASGSTGVLELPIGDILGDAAAMYRATLHDHPTVNGMSGHDPMHDAVLRLALAEGDSAALDVIGEHGPLLIAVDKQADVNGGWIALVVGRRGIARVREDARWALFRLPKRDPPSPIVAGGRIPIVAVQDDRGAVDTRPLVDDDPATGWFRTNAQFPGEALRVDIGRTARLGSVEMSLGRNGQSYPRMLSVATSTDGERWTPAYSGRTGALAYRAALANPRDVRLIFPLEGIEARFIRLRLESAYRKLPWFVADVIVRGVP
jgi:hypothetical protein